MAHPLAPLVLVTFARAPRLGRFPASGFASGFSALFFGSCYLSPPPPPSLKHPPQPALLASPWYSSRSLWNSLSCGWRASFFARCTSLQVQPRFL